MVLLGAGSDLGRLDLVLGGMGAFTEGCVTGQLFIGLGWPPAINGFFLLFFSFPLYFFGLAATFSVCQDGLVLLISW